MADTTLARVAALKTTPMPDLKRQWRRLGRNIGTSCPSGPAGRHRALSSWSTSTSSFCIGLPGAM